MERRYPLNGLCLRAERSEGQYESLAEILRHHKRKSGGSINYGKVSPARFALYNLTPLNDIRLFEAQFR